jgi:hypothetical protein
MALRVRWGNVGRAGAGVALVALVVAWPRLAGPVPEVPGGEARPVVAGPVEVPAGSVATPRKRAAIPRKRRVVPRVATPRKRRHRRTAHRGEARMVVRPSAVVAPVVTPPAAVSPPPVSAPAPTVDPAEREFGFER